MSTPGPGNIVEDVVDRALERFSVSDGARLIVQTPYGNNRRIRIADIPEALPDVAVSEAVYQIRRQNTCKVRDDSLAVVYE